MLVLFTILHIHCFGNILSINRLQEICHLMFYCTKYTVNMTIAINMINDKHVSDPQETINKHLVINIMITKRDHNDMPHAPPPS